MITSIKRINIFFTIWFSSPELIAVFLTRMKIYITDQHSIQAPKKTKVVLIWKITVQNLIKLFDILLSSKQYNLRCNYLTVKSRLFYSLAQVLSYVSCASFYFLMNYSTPINSILHSVISRLVKLSKRYGVYFIIVIVKTFFDLYVTIFISRPSYLY